MATKKNLIFYKIEVDKLDVNRLVNAPTTLNNLKTKVSNLDVGKLKMLPLDLKKLNVVDKEVVKNTKFHTLKTQLNQLDQKIPDATTLIRINQYNTDKQNLEKKTKDVVNTTTVFNTKILEVKSKIINTTHPAYVFVEYS